MGIGNSQQRNKRHRHGQDKDKVRLVIQQSTQQASKDISAHPEPRANNKSKEKDGVAPPANVPPPEPVDVVPPVVPVTKALVPPVSVNKPTPALPATPPPAPVANAANGAPLFANAKHSGRHTGQRTPSPQGELTDMLDTLRAVFVHDRTLGAHTDAMRCGVCYLMFAAEDASYREEEGFYACPACTVSLGNQSLIMLRRQRK